MKMTLTLILDLKRNHAGKFQVLEFKATRLTLNFDSKKTEKPALIPAVNKPASRYGQLAPKGLKSKLLGRLQGNSRQYFDSGDYNGDKTARRPSAPKLVPGKA